MSLNTSIVHLILLWCLLLGSDAVDGSEIRDVLSGYGDSEYGEEMREKVRAELSGREQEVWTYIKDAISDSSGVSDNLAISTGIRALHDLNGFSEEILEEYAEILRTDSYRVGQLNDVLGRTTPVPKVNSDAELREYRQATKALGLIRGSFFVFERYGEGLSRDTVSRLLQLNDGQVQKIVAEWYRANGNSNDLPILRARAAELEASGDQPGSDLVSSVVQHIQSGSTEAAFGLAEIDAAANQPAVSEQSSSSERDNEQVVPTSSQSPLWPYALVAIAIVGIVVVLMRSRKGDPDPPEFIN